MPDDKKVPAVNVAKGSPAVGVPLAVAKLGDTIIKHTPKRLRDEVAGAARKVRRYAEGVGQRMRAKARVAAHGARMKAARAARKVR